MMNGFFIDRLVFACRGILYGYENDSAGLWPALFLNPLKSFFYEIKFNRKGYPSVCICITRIILPILTVLILEAVNSGLSK